MKEECSFEFEAKPIQVRLKEIPGLVARLIHEQRVVVWLMNAHVGGVAQSAMEVPIEDLYRVYGKAYKAFYTHNESDFERYAEWHSAHSMFVRLNPDWQRIPVEDDPEVRQVVRELYPIERQFERRWAVDLVSPADGVTLDWNRADDLIVRLTLMLRMSQPFFPDEG
jgi:hypothetical protein